MERITRICSQCAGKFEVTEEEMRLYERLKYDLAPKRCRECRGAKRAIDEAVKPKKLMYAVICAECGCKTEVPFQPTGDKPVYCQKCFAANKAN